MPEPRAEHRWVRLAGIATLAFGIGSAPFLLLGPWDRDEGIFAVISKAWTRGELPYRDHFDQKPPGLFAVGAAALLLGGGDPVALRAVIALAHAATAFLLHRWTRPRAGRDAALLAAGLYVLAAPRFQGAVFHTEPFLALATLGSAMLFLAGARDAQAPRWVLPAAGLAFGAAFTFKQPALAVLPAFAAAYLLARRARLREPAGWWRLGADAAAFAVPALAPYALFALYFAAHGGLDWFVFGTWTANVAHYEGNGVAAAWRGLLAAFSTAPALFFPALVGVAAAASARSSEPDVLWHRFVALLFFASLLPLYYRTVPHYFLPALPFAAILAAVALARLISLLPDVPVARLRPHAIAALGVGAYFLFAAPAATVKEEVSGLQVENLYFPAGAGAYLRERTDASDRILFYPRVLDVAFFAERSGLRNNVAYVWPGVLFEEEELIREIDRGTFKYAVLEAATVGEVGGEFASDAVAKHVLGNYPRETFLGDWVVYRLR